MVKMNYKLIVEEPNTQFNVVVFETATEQVIKRFQTVAEAKKFMRNLNLGVVSMDGPHLFCFVT